MTGEHQPKDMIGALGGEVANLRSGVGERFYHHSAFIRIDACKKKEEK